MRLISLSVLFLTLEIINGYQGVFWHVCDVHLNLSYDDQINVFGNYDNDSPLKLVKSAFDEMKIRYSNPDFILFNGDSVYHGLPNETNFKEALSTVSSELYKIFPKSNTLPSLGNHDINPSSNLNSVSNWCIELFEIWRQFFINQSSSEIKTFKKGCYYSRIINSNNSMVNVIVLNTILWYSVNSYFQISDDPLNQFAWLEEQLIESRSKNIAVFIVGHVPPGASEYSPNQYRHLHPPFNEKFVKLMQQYSDIIDAGFFSHQHTDAFKIVYDSKDSDKPRIPLFLSPSVSPFNLNGLGSVNPSIRLYHWRDNVTKRRFEQYHLKLQPPFNWTLEYNSTKYLEEGLSADHLNNLVKDFSSEKSRYFDRFFEYHLSGRKHVNEDCPVNSSCRCNIVCGIRHIDYTKLDTCLKSCPQKSLSQWVMIASVIIIFTIILIAIVIGANKVYCRGRRTASLTRDIYLAPFNGKNCEEIMSEHIDHIAESTFGDVPEYRGHIRNNSRTILTLNDGNEIVEKSSHSSISKFTLQSKNKPQEKYDYTRM